MIFFMNMFLGYIFFTFIEKNTELNKAVKNVTNKCINIERFLE